MLNPYAGPALFIIVWLAIIAAIGAFTEKIFGPKQQFSEHQNEISVLSSDFSQRISGSNTYVTVVGTLTNSSHVGWKDVIVEAQFFDNAGRLIDAIPAANYGGVTVLPHGVAAFKIETKAAKTESNYATHKVFVRSAKDVDAWGF